MNDAATDAQRDYRDTVFLPQTSFPMRGDLPKKEPQILARWDAMDLWGKLRAASAGRPTLHPARRPALRERQHPYRHGAEQDPQGRDQPHPPDGGLRRQLHPRLGLPRPADRVEDRGGTPPQERRTRTPFRSWISAPSAAPTPSTGWGCRRKSSAAWASRATGATATPPWTAASEAAIAAEIGKFLLNGALYRGLRPVMWSPVEKTALAEAEIEYHDHTSTTIWVRFPVAEPLGPGVDRRVGGDLDHHALDHAGQPRDRGRRRSSTTRWSRSMAWRTARWPGSARSWSCAGRCCRRSEGPRHHCPSRASMCSRVPNSPGTICAHPLRGRGYDQDTPLLLGDFVTTEAGTGFVHIAPGHGEDDFDLGRANGLEVPETVGDDGTFNAWVPLFAGLHVYKAADPVCAALTEAGGLLARGKLVHSYPHSWRSKAPLIFRATPQWFIRMDGPEHIRAKALAAIDATHFVPDRGRNRLGWMVGEPSGLVHQPPARLGRADRGVRRQAHRRAAARSRRGASASSPRSPPKARTPGIHRRRRASSAPIATRTTTSR